MLFMLIITADSVKLENQSTSQRSGAAIAEEVRHSGVTERKRK